MKAQKEKLQSEILTKDESVIKANEDVRKAIEEKTQAEQKLSETNTVL